MSPLTYKVFNLYSFIRCGTYNSHLYTTTFYGVDPSEVRHQTGQFGSAFQNLLKRIAKMEHMKWLLEEKKMNRHLVNIWKHGGERRFARQLALQDL